MIAAKTRPVRPCHAVVIGATGFLGSALVGELIASGHDVTAICRRPLDGKEASVRASHAKLRWTVTDIQNPDSLKVAFEGADIVFHCATSTHPTSNLSQPNSEIAMSLVPTIHVMEAAVATGVKKLVFPSSGGTVYSDSSKPRSESSAVSPVTPYSIFKYACEQLLLSTASRSKAFAVDVFRIANLYGPGQPRRPGQGVLPHWVNAIRSGTPVSIFGDGTIERDFVWIYDAVHCMMSSCNRLSTSDVFNIGTGVATSLNDLVSLIKQASAIDFEVRYEPARSVDAQSVCLDPSKILSVLDDFAWMPLSVGIAKTLLSEGLAVTPDALANVNAR